MKKYQIKSAGGVGELLIYGDIGDSWFEDESISARAVAEDLSKMDVSLVNVHINSFGGSVADGLAIYNALASHKAEVHVHVDGVAISIASLISMAGDKVYMAENALMMVHAPWGVTQGNAKEMREMADTLDTIAEAMATSYARKTRKPKDEMLALLLDGQDHWYTASEAVEAGFADEVTEPLQIAAMFKTNRFTQPAAVVATHQKEATMPTEAKGQATETVAAVDNSELIAKTSEDAIATERNRVASINEIAAKFNKRDLADNAIKAGLSADDFRAEMLDVLAKEKEAPAKKLPQSAPIVAVENEPVFKRLSALKGFKSEKDAYTSGQFILATLFKRQSAMRWMQDRFGSDFMAALGENVGTKGGFLVPDEFSQAVIDLREEYGIARRVCRVLPMGSDTLLIPRQTGNMTTYYVGENTEITASDVAFDQVTLVARKLAAITRIASELAEDAVVDIAQLVVRDIAWGFANAEDNALFNGDGTSTYGGIYGVRPKIIDGNHAAGAVDAASGNDTFAEVTLADLHNMMAALPQYALRNAAFYISQPGFALVLERLTAAAGGNTIGTLEAGMQPRFLGYPVYVTQAMPTSTGDLSNVVMVLFGDMSLAATMGDRRMIRVMQDESRYLEYDQLAIRATERFDINVHDLGDGTTAGPIVALVGE